MKIYAVKVKSEFDGVKEVSRKEIGDVVMDDHKIESSVFNKLHEAMFTAFKNFKPGKGVHLMMVAEDGTVADFARIMKWNPCIFRENNGQFIPKN